MYRALVLAASVGCSFTGPSIDVTGDTDAGDVDAGNAFLDGWMHRREITLLASQVVAPGDAALANFPVMISLIDEEISDALPDRSDIAFTRSDAITRLEHEIESIDTGQLVAWVKVESLAALTDTKIFVYYGNQTPPAITPQAVWTESFHAVYHLQQDPGPGAAGEILDSTTAHHGTAEGSMVTENGVRGQIGRGIEFDGSNDCIDLPSFDVGAAFTVSVWINMRNVSEIRTLLSNSQDGNSTDGFRFFVNSANGGNRRVLFETGNNNNDGATAESPDGAIADSVPVHVAAIVDRTAGTATLLVNGAIVNATDTAIRTDFATASDFEIGRMESNNPFSGTLDELEIASTARPVEWIQTARTNQLAPREFYMVGEQQTR